VPGSGATDDAGIADATPHRAVTSRCVARSGVPRRKWRCRTTCSLKSAQLVDRGFFTAVEHGEWERRLVGVPWRPFGGPPIPLGVPPRLEPMDGAVPD
jgi:hypothetical protein